MLEVNIVIAYTPAELYDQPAHPVCFVAPHLVREGKEGEYENWLLRSKELVIGYSGCLGVQAARRSDGSRESVLVVYFVSSMDASKFMEDDDQKVLLDSVRPCIEGDVGLKWSRALAADYSEVLMQQQNQS